MEFIAATNNAHKLLEMRRILEHMGHSVISQKEAGIALDPEENGASFAENAIIKAKAIFDVCGKPVIADDSGICVDALGGAPGVYSARYCGAHGEDEKNNDKLLAEMKNVAFEKRTAHFTSAICVYENGRSFVFEGECQGVIGFERKGTNGFGYDPLFCPIEYGTRSYAELSDAEKDAISHRGRALEKMERELPALIENG